MMSMRGMMMLSVVLVLAGCSSSVPETLTLERSQPFKLADADGDGVVDARDQCANSPAGVTADAQGCTEWEWKGYEQLYFVFFDFDKSLIREDQQEVMDEIAGDVLSDLGRFANLDSHGQPGGDCRGHQPGRDHPV